MFKMEILLDTNFLMLPAQGTDIYRQLEGRLITLSACMKELEKIAKGNGKQATEARVAMELVKKHVMVVGADRKADKAIHDYALKNGCAVATNDRELIESLKRHNIKIIRLRQGKYLIEE